MKFQLPDTPLNRSKKYFVLRQNDVEGIKTWVRDAKADLKRHYSRHLASLILFLEELLNYKLNPLPQNDFLVPAEFSASSYDNVATINA